QGVCREAEEGIGFSLTTVHLIFFEKICIVIKKISPLYKIIEYNLNGNRSNMKVMSAHTANAVSNIFE
ncbi:MAG: hypothetical protein AAB151_05240, partial [Nitrospirota bacterium]